MRYDKITQQHHNYTVSVISTHKITATRSPLRFPEEKHINTAW